MGSFCTRVVRCFSYIVLGLAILALTACYSSGNRYAASGKSWLQPGISSAADARIFLEGDPVAVYPQTDGSSLHVWQHSRALLPDGVYYNKELWLEFDKQGILRRIVKQ